MSIDTSKVAAASFYQGIKDLGTNVTVSGTIPATALGATTIGSSVTSVNIAFPTVNALSLMRIKLNGLSAANSNYWFPMSGSCVIREGNFQIVFIAKGTSTGKTVTVGLNNAGAAATFGGCTFDVYTHFYQFPWIP